MAENNLVRTGIAGLDALLLGGIPRTNVILVQGGLGSGKTLLGVEFIYRGITQFNEPGIIVVFETSPDKLIRDAAAMGWDLAALAGAEEASNRLYQPAGARSGTAFGGQPAAGNGGRNGRPTHLYRWHRPVAPGLRTPALR